MGAETQSGKQVSPHKQKPEKPGDLELLIYFWTFLRQQYTLRIFIFPFYIFFPFLVLLLDGVIPLRALQREPFYGKLSKDMPSKM